MSTRSAEAEVKLSFNATITNALGSSAGAGNSNVTANHNATIVSGRINDGIGSGQANRAWWSEGRTLGSGGNETLDLYNMTGLDIGAGSGNDALGQALTVEEAVGIIIYVDPASTGALQIEPGSSNPLNCFGSGLTVANGGALNAGGVAMLWQPGADGIDLSSTKKNLKFTASGGDVTYSVYVLGRHDDDESSSTSSLSSSSSTSSSSSSASSSSSSSSSSSG